MLQYIKYVPLSLFVTAFIKGIIIGFGIHDVAVLLVLGSIAAFYEFQNQTKKFAELELALKNHKEKIEKLTVDIDAVKTGITSVKLSQGFRPQVRNNG